MSASSDYFSDNETERPNEHEINEEESNEIDFEVLHPEHPLMIKFQKALKKSLLNKIQKLELENNELEYEVKTLTKENEHTSEKLYDEKKEVDKLRRSIEECSESLSNLITERQREEEELNREKEEEAKLSAELKEAEKKYDELRIQIETQTNWLHQLQRYEEEQASNLAVMSQIISRSKSDLKNTLSENEKQDYLLMRLENEIFKEKMEIENYEKQIKDACAQLATLQAKLNEKENEFQKESEDNKRLLKLWQDLVYMVSKRDEKCSEMKKQLEEAETERKSILGQIRNYERSTEEEMVKGEHLLALKNKREEELRAAERTFHDLTQEKKELQDELAKLNDMVECTEVNFKHATEELQDQERELDELDKTIKKLNDEKYKLEESVLFQVQDEMISNKEATKMYNEIKKIRQEISEKEAQVKEIEQKYQIGQQDLEMKLKELKITETCVKEKTISVKALGEEFQKNKAKLERTKLEVKKQNCILDKKKKELKALQEKPIPSEYEEQMKQIQEDTKEAMEKIEQKKREWIRMQNRVTLLSEKKSQYFNELNEIRKNTSLLQQTSRELEEKIFRAEQEGKQIDKTIEYLHRQLSKVNAEYYERKRQVEALESENFVSQNEGLEKLKEAENEAVVTVEEIEELEKTKKSLQEKILQLQREDLEWEKKIKMVTEMKRNMMQDMSENGDIGAMKTEIHRMEIRYAQLKKAQDSLAADLESCVAKRDDIDDKVTIREKKKNREMLAAQAFARKLRNIEAEVAKLEKNLKIKEEENSALEKEKQSLVEDTKKAEIRIQELEARGQELDEKIQQATLEKQKNLEILVSKQKLADYLFSVKTGKIKGANLNGRNTAPGSIKSQ